MKYFTSLGFWLVFFVLNCHGQSKPDPDLQKFYAEKIGTNGVVTSIDLTTLPYVDIDRIATFNFDPYRAYDTRQQIKLINGPLVELFSIKEMQAMGKIIDLALVEKKRDIATSKYKYALITELDAKIGYKPPVRDREKNLIFKTPNALH
jgi:hypothetical protein